jgi:hypothetical protein
MPRFFSIPDIDSLPEESPLKQHFTTRPRKKRVRKGKTMRYAAYVRISSEEQVGNFSVDAQRRAIQTWVEAQGGTLAKVYLDEAQCQGAQLTALNS